MKNEVLVCASGFSVNLKTELTRFFRETARSKTFSFSLLTSFVKNNVIVHQINVFCKVLEATGSVICRSKIFYFLSLIITVLK